MYAFQLAAKITFQIFMFFKFKFSYNILHFILFQLLKEFFG